MSNHIQGLTVIFLYITNFNHIAYITQSVECDPLKVEAVGSSPTMGFIFYCCQLCHVMSVMIINGHERCQLVMTSLSLTNLLSIQP